MYDTILVPTDGSAGADVALEHAADAAARHGATVHVVHVVEAWNLERFPATEDSRLERADELVADAVDALPADVPVESSVEVGVAYETILEYAADHGVDLVVVGSHGLTGVRRYLLGSVAERVVRLADVPVLTVRPTDDDPTFPYRNVLVPTDGSEGAAAAVDPSVDLAADGATLHAVSVVDERMTRFPARHGSGRDPLEARARSAVESVEEAAREAGLDAVRTEVLTGTPHRALLTYVDDHDVDLVVLGTHGRTGLDRYLLGSVTGKVLRLSPVPVMTVAPTPDDD